MFMKLMFVLSFVLFAACGIAFCEESAATTSTDETAVSAQEETASQPQGTVSVSDAKFCTSVTERQPVGENSTFSTGNNVIYYWCTVNTDAAPTSISHVWTFNGETKAEIPLNIKYEKMRTWSYKTILPEWTGEWTVETKDSNGNVIRKDSFTYGKAEPEAAPQSTN